MMEARLKGCLKAIVLELRRQLEGCYDAQGNWQAGDLEHRLAAIGVRQDRAPVPVDEVSYLSPEDRKARRVVDAFLKAREDAGIDRVGAVVEFVAKSAYTWANRLLALRCMEARGLIEEVILQKEVYGGRSLQHNRLARKEPERCAGEDEGLFALLFNEFEERAKELPLLFNPRAPDVALRPSVAALKSCITLLSGPEMGKSQETASDEVFSAPDALGWAYQYWNTEEKDRVFDKVRTKKGAKIEGADIIPVTCIYTEPYMVKLLVQNSLGALWMGMYPDSRLYEHWEYYVRDADRAPASRRPLQGITFLDPACGSGHFLIEAFDLFYEMYREEGRLTEPAAICASILEHNLYGTDIDERAVQIAALALVMKAKEKASDFVPRRVNLVATNIRLPAGKDHLEAFISKHCEDEPLKPALLTIFEAVVRADEIGSLIQVEEPVARELRHLRELYEARKGKAEQTVLWPELEEPVQGRLPLGVETYEAWQARTIERLRRHFDTETQAPDLVAALFGEAGAKGLSLVEVLSRRYDVVATNPPYMGSKNMGPVLKGYIEKHFEQGKRDLYAAFILRCLELAAIGGRVAMVTQQSWMFLRSFSDLRALEDEKRRTAPRAFGGVLRETTIEALAHLGPHAFGEIGGEVVNTALFVLARLEPRPDHRLTTFRIIGPKTPEEKYALLRQAVHNGATGITFRPKQARFLSIPQTPLCYWLRERFFELLAGKSLADVAGVHPGLCTGHDARFTRFVWEVPPAEWGRPLRSRRWVPFEKGGGYGKWFGHHFWAVDWQHEGARMKNAALPGTRVQNEKHYFKKGWTYSYMARGSYGLRYLDGAGLFAHISSAVLPHFHAARLAVQLNIRLSSFLVRALAARIQLTESYVWRLPVLDRIPAGLEALEQGCIVLKRCLVAHDPTERTFGGLAISGVSLGEACLLVVKRAEAVAVMLHAFEGLAEREVFASYGIEGEDLAAVVDETGTPAGWFPLLSGYDASPSLPEGLEGGTELLTPLAKEPRRNLTVGEGSALKRRLRTLYEAGWGANPEEGEEEAVSDEDNEEGAEAVSGARIPIPTETFLEELAQKLKVHPISVYWLLRELCEKDGVVCASEVCRFVEDYMSVLVLRLLGHRWPKEVELEEEVPEWADPDGIIPLTEGTGELSLMTRLRERIAKDFSQDRVGSIEREFEDIMGKPLSVWLASDFFKHHVSQFRKRPVAWHIESARSNGKRGRRGKGNAPPAFSCFLYYHRLDGDLVPKLRSQYVGPLRARFQTEIAGLERLDKRTAEQDERRVQLEMLLEELKDFDALLEQVSASGFSSTAVDAVAPKEPLDKWTSRDEQTPRPATWETFLAEERRYDPDINDGVRVNIAPLQKAGLLATDVLPAKDVEKASADRAEWRADERRWCREGKLPHPGWWPAPGLPASTTAGAGVQIKGRL